MKQQISVKTPLNMRPKLFIFPLELQAGNIAVY